MDCLNETPTDEQLCEIKKKIEIQKLGFNLFGCWICFLPNKAVDDE